MNKRWMWMAVAATLVVTGCKKDAKKSESKPADGSAAAPKNPGTTAEAAPGGTAAVPAAVAGRMPTGMDRLLAALPMDSEFVFGIDVGRLRSSALIGPLLDQMMAMNNGKMGFDMKADCGIDPAKTVGQGVFGLKMSSPDDIQVAGSFTGVGSAPALACIEKARSKIESNGVKLTVDGKYVLMTTTKDGKDVQIGMIFADDNTIFMKTGTGPVDKASLDKMTTAKAGEGLTGSAEFMSMINATNTGATVWGLVRGSAPIMAKAPVKFKAAFGSIDITDGVVVDGRLRMNSADEAGKVATMAGAQLNQVKGMGLFDGDVKADGADVRIAITMNKAQVDKLKTLAGSAFSGFLGKGGGGMGNGMGGGGIGP